MLLKLLIFGILGCNVLAYASAAQCPAEDGPDAVYLSDETDCSGFYECSNGASVHIDCPPGLDFNLDLNVCDYPDQAGCRGVPTEEPTTEGGDDSGDETSESDEDDDSDSSDESDSDDDDENESGDDDDGDEDDDEDADDDGDENADDDEDADADGDDDVDEETSTDSTLFKLISGNIEIDPRQGSACSTGLGLLRIHPESCTKYLRCYKGVTLVKNCAKGYYFDQNTRICVAPEYTKCANQS